MSFVNSLLVLICSQGEWRIQDENEFFFAKIMDDAIFTDFVRAYAHRTKLKRKMTIIFTYSFILLLLGVNLSLRCGTEIV